jgi:hypothetical protein
MKAIVSILLLFSLLFFQTGCRNNTEGIMESKILTVNTSMSDSNPYKTVNHKKRSSVWNGKRADDVQASVITESTVEDKEYIINTGSDEDALSELFSELSEQKQFFYLNPESDTVLVCKRGTIIRINAGTFANASNKRAPVQVRLEVTEYLSKSEFIYAALSTYTNKGDLLESGGTILLKAYSGKEELTIAKGKSIQFQMPSENKKEGMELFAGVRDINGTMKWFELDKKKSRKSYRKEVAQNAKYRIDIDERILVRYKDGEEIYSQEYLNIFSNVNLKNKKLDTLSVYFEIDENNILKNGSSKRTTRRGKTRPTLYNPSNIFSKNFTKEGEKLNLNSSYKVIPELYNTADFSFKKEWLKTKKNKENNKRVITVLMQRVSIYTDSIDHIYTKAKLGNIEAKLTKDNEITTSDIEYYVFSASQLGWINVDRFLHIKGPKAKFVLDDKNFENSKVSLVFKNYESVLPGHEENGKVSFNNIPLGEEVTIVAVKMNKGIPMLYVKDIKTDRSMFEERVDFRAVSVATLKEEIKRINNK